MVRLKLEIQADLENVTDLRPSSDDFDFFFNVTCTTCHETHPKPVSVNRLQEREVSGGKNTTAHFVWRCGNCKRESSAKFDPSFPVRPYRDSGSFAELLVIECRGLEFVGFDPMGTWTCNGNKGQLFEVEFQDGYWADYDEDARLPVQIDFKGSRWSRA
ncbi:DUF866-domain-containing protein [Pisolithus thermaeus]|nr:DUF866-domain-containing protein [Pisolithus thermaeus]